MSCHEEHEHHHEHHHGHHHCHKHHGEGDRDHHSECRCCGCGCHCECGPGCGCGGERHGCEDKNRGFPRRFRSKAEKLAKLEAYLSELKAEAQAVEERLAELRR